MIQKNADIICKNLFFVFLFYILVNFPLIILTWNTGYWSDDYQYINLLSVKWDVSSFSRNILDLLEPKVDGHVSPVYYLFNILVGKISSSPQFFHSVIVFFHILTSLVIFLCVRFTHKNNFLALISGVLFALSYFINFKAIAWNCFNSHVINTFTGIFSLYWALKYLRTRKLIYIIFTFLFMIVTILNYESGFVFPIILVVFIIFSLKKKLHIDLP